MEVLVIKTGYLEENCYLITINKKTLVVDPGDEFNKIKEKISDNNLNIVGILITHFHFDHVGVLKEVENEYKVPVISIKNKKIIEEFDYEIIETKGHTDDSVSYYFKKNNSLFCGDFIFKKSIGRYDFYNSSKKDMFKSIEQLKKYDKNLIIYPGHGDKTTLEYELKYNEFLR